ncbi:DUF4040 domain-containing protein [Erythrobacteraceae bacterium CFH 75059]|uniref:MnhB domain-containing protein n=1 Tax=Qipengyuania thermophila TaxID=2509361 RepID=UPI00101F7CCE|nr:MnhB domain-containing protein [Qipengyuania thermophila]TCD06778.1 DUF4040 domain-containing protein [Erythrobacteraceae bacterium CFH 75059]
MIASAAFDILLCLLIVTVAVGSVAARDLFGAVALYIVYGLLLAIGWVRLGAVDVGLAEGAIGAGLTGVLLLGAAARLKAAPDPPRLRIVPLLLCLAVSLGLGAAVLSLSVPQPGLVPLVQENLAASGVGNPVTAVLLNFRGWDTLVESVVLVVALVGVWALAPDDLWDGRPGAAQRVKRDAVLNTFGRLLPPVGLMVGIYIVWIGAYAPGGAFQAGTVLAAVWLLAIMAGVAEPPPVRRPLWRALLVLGPAVFLLAGLHGTLWGAFMSFAPAKAKTMIMAIEFTLTLSIAVTLAMLVLGRPRRPA